MNQLMKEIQIVSMYYENAESKALNNFYMEAVADEVDATSENRENFLVRLARKTVETIEKIIQAFKDFIRSIRDRIQVAGLKRDLAKMRKEQMRILKGKINDKEVVAAANKMLKVGEAHVADIYKLYNAYSSRRIDMETFRRKMQDMEEKFERTSEMIANGTAAEKLVEVQSSSLRSNTYKISEVADRLQRVADYQEKAIDKINDDVDRITAQLKKDAEKHADNPEEASATAEAASKVTASGRKTVNTVIKVVGILSAVTAAAVGGYEAYKHRDSIKSHFMKESYDFEDALADIFEESNDYDYDSDYSSYDDFDIDNYL